MMVFLETHGWFRETNTKKEEKERTKKKGEDSWRFFDADNWWSEGNNNSNERYKMYYTHTQT